MKEALKLSKDPVKLSAFHGNLGFIYYTQYRYKESLLEYRKALEMTKKDNEKEAYLGFICSILIKMGRWEEAKTACVIFPGMCFGLPSPITVSKALKTILLHFAIKIERKKHGKP